MDKGLLVTRIDEGVTIAVATSHPFFCVGGATAAEARAIAARARAFYRTSAKPRPTTSGPVGKADFVRPARKG